VSIEEIAKEAEIYVKKHLYELFGNDVEIERRKK
jgi:hypothetical protein